MNYLILFQRNKDPWFLAVLILTEENIKSTHSNWHQEKKKKKNQLLWLPESKEKMPLSSKLHSVSYQVVVLIIHSTNKLIYERSYIMTCNFLPLWSRTLKSMLKTAFLSMFFVLHMTFNIAMLVSQRQVFLKKQVSKFWFLNLYLHPWIDSLILQKPWATSTKFPLI